MPWTRNAPSCKKAGWNGYLELRAANGGEVWNDADERAILIGIRNTDDERRANLSG